MGLCRSKLASATASNTSELKYTFREAKVVKVYDGDTFWIAAKFNGITQFKVRLYGVDCAEMRADKSQPLDVQMKNKKLAIQAKQYVEAKILNKIVQIQILNNTVYNGVKITEKYGRLLCIIHINGVNLAEDLIAQNLGKPYYGGTKL